MDYLTRQLLLELIKLREAYEKQSSAINAVEKENHQEQQIQRKLLKEIYSAHEESVRHNSVSNSGENKIQNSIRYATWVTALAAFATFLAASIYACITYQQWETAKQALEAQTRPWVGPEGTIEVVGNNTLSKDSSILNIRVPLINYGQSPALLPVLLTFSLVRGGSHSWDGQYHFCKRAGDPLLDISGTTNELRTIFPHSPSQKFESSAGFIAAQNNPRFDGAQELQNGNVRLAGCIAYRSADGKIRYTDVTYNILGNYVFNGENTTLTVSGFQLMVTQTKDAPQ